MCTYVCTKVCLCATLGEKRGNETSVATQIHARCNRQVPLDVNCLEDWQEGDVDRSDEMSHCGVT